MSEHSSVYPVYFYPAGELLDQEVVAALPGLMAEIQAYTSAQLGGPTFSVATPRVVEGLWPKEHYLDGYTWGRILEDIAFQKATPNGCSGPVNGPDPHSITIVFAHTSIARHNGGTPCGGYVGPYGGLDWRWAGDGGGIAVMGEASLNAHLGRPHPWYENTGWIIHELYHCFTLAHSLLCEGLIIDPLGRTLEPVDCALDIMWSQHAYPNARLGNTLTNPAVATMLGHPLVDLSGVEPLDPIPSLPSPDDGIIPEPAEEPSYDSPKPGKRVAWGRKGGRPK